MGDLSLKVNVRQSVHFCKDNEEWALSKIVLPKQPAGNSHNDASFRELRPWNNAKATQTMGHVPAEQANTP
jgi:hypothetical protein